MQCGLCSDEISDGALCSGCGKDIGFCCSNVAESTYRKYKADRKAAWKCQNCQKSKREPSPAQLEPTDLMTVMNILKGMEKQLLCLPGLVRNIGILKTELSEVKDSCSFINKKLEEYSVRLVEAEKKIVELEDLKGKVQTLANDNTMLKEENARYNQQMRLNNVEIKGVPIKKNENLFKILEDISTAVDLPVDKRHINYISRVPVHNSNEKSIVINFINRYTKEDFVASARLKKTITAEEIGFQGNMQRVYINDHLTPENKKLLTLTKSTLKQKNYLYVWVKFCKIHVRKDDRSKVHIINNERDLNRLP